MNNTSRANAALTKKDTSVQTFSTCDFCDAHKSSDGRNFRVLPQVFQSFGASQSFFGEVVTVKCYEDNSHVKAQVESPGLGRVLVVDGGAVLSRALLGGNLAAAAAANGWSGLLINGAVRDVEELRVSNVGILALASVPMPTQRQNQGQSNVAICIQGVWIYPGDNLYADRDGIVISAEPLL